MALDEGGREPSPSGGTGKRTDAHDGRGRGFNNTAGEHRHGSGDAEYDHRREYDRKRRDNDHVSRQHAQDVKDGHGRQRLDDDSHRRRHEADDASHSRSRRGLSTDVDDFSSGSQHRQHRHQEGSVRERSPHRRSSDSYWRRYEVDDANHSRSRHGHGADVDDFSSEGQHRRHRYHEGSVRERSPHRSSFHDRRVGYEDGYKRSGHTGENEKTNSSSNYQKTVDTDSGRDHFASRDVQRRDDVLPELYSVHRAKVQSVRPFGVFVRLEGFYKQGLVHLSQLSDHEVTDREESDEMKIKAIAAVAGEGDQVWVKVISLKDDGGNIKIGCSLKLVSQSTGKDLDPSNLKLDQHQPKADRQEIKKVTLDAIYNVVCSRCGGHGHLKTECYGMANKAYELIPEEEADFPEELAQPPEPQASLGEVSAKPGFGRGRAMVLPAWMTHGSGAAAPQILGSTDHEKKRKATELPDKISTVEEAMALIAEVKKARKDKHRRRKEHHKHKKDKKSKRSSKKKRSSEKDTA